MKTMLRSLPLILMCLLFSCSQVTADDDKPIDFVDLPEQAQTFVSNYFAEKTVALAKVESGLFRKKYDVIFTDGTKLEFDGKGNWTEVDCRKSSVPADVVPTEISKYLASTYSDAQILKIEHEDGDYEVSLSSGMEITFNKKFQVIDID